MSVLVVFLCEVVSGPGTVPPELGGTSLEVDRGTSEEPGAVAGVFEEPGAVAGVFEEAGAVAEVFEEPGAVAGVFEEPGTASPVLWTGSVPSLVVLG